MLKMGIIPDKFVLLNQTDEYSEERIRETLKADDSIVKCKKDQASRLAHAAISENNVHMASVKKVCQGYITELDGSKNET